MRGALLLAARHVMHNRVASVVLMLCIAVTLLLPGASQVVVMRFQSALTSRAEQVPLVAGTKGSRFDLALSTMFFRESELSTIPMSELFLLRDSGMGVAVGMSTRFTTQGRPLVGIGREYFEQQGLSTAEGTLPLLIGDVVLGANLARALDVAPGDELYSDQRDEYNIATPPSIRLHVCGVLSKRGTPDDDAAFVDLKTTWLLEGISHAHIDAEEVDDALVLGEAEGQRVLSQALIEDNQVTDANVGSFHMHADEATLPLTSILFFPNDERAATIIKARLNRSDAYQMVSPSKVVDELLAYVFRIKSLIDTLSLVLGVCTVLLAALVVMLSLRLRARELETLNRIGCSRFTTVTLVGVELLIILAVSAAIAIAGTLLAALAVNDVTGFLS